MECMVCGKHLEYHQIEYDYMGNEWCHDCLEEETIRAEQFYNKERILLYLEKKRFSVELQQIDLEEAVSLISNHSTVFYTYEVGKPIWLLDENSLLSSIKNKAIYLTPCSYVEEIKER